MHPLLEGVSRPSPNLLGENYINVRAIISLGRMLEPIYLLSFFLLSS